MNLKENSENFKFPKSERLSGKRLIDELFEKGSSQFLYPFWILCLNEIKRETGLYPKVLFSIPKKNFKRAVDRNRIRRQLREAYRKHKKAIFYDSGETVIP